jgi:hypothetical protein
MRRATRIFLCLYFVTLWTYGVAECRLPESFGALPYGVVLLVLCWIALLCSWMNRIWGLPKPTRSALYATGCYILGSLLSVIGATQVDYLLLFKVCAFPTLVVLVIAVQSKLGDVKAAIIALGVGGGLLAIYGLYGFVTWRTGDLTEHVQMYFGVAYTGATRNADALYLIVPFWCLVGALWSGYGTAGSLIRKTLAWCLLTGLGIALTFTYVRGIWITMPLTFLFGGVMLRKWTSKAKLIAGATIALLILTAAASGLVNSLEAAGVPASRMLARMNTIASMEQPTSGGNSNENRLDLILGALAIGAKHSPLGIGVGQFRYAIEKYTEFPANHAENMYLQVFAEQGWLSLIGLTWISMLMIGPRLGASFDAETRFVRGTCRLIGVNLVMYAMFNELTESLWFWTVVAVCAAANLEAEAGRCKARCGNTTQGWEPAKALKV